MKETVKDSIGQLCTIVGIVVGVIIGAAIMLKLENGLGMIILFTAPLLGGYLGAKLGIGLCENTNNSSNKNTNLPNNQTAIYNNLKNNNISHINVYPTFRRTIENEFENSIKKAINDSMDKAGDNPLLMGILVQAAITYTCKSLKEADFKATGMSKQAIDTIIDEVTKNMLHKYLENY